MANFGSKIFHIYGKTARVNGPRGGYAWFRADKSKCEWEFLDEVTRNQGEYMAFVCVLRYVAANSRVLIFTDSQLFVDQFTGKRRVDNPELRKLAGRVRKLIEEKQLEVRVVRRPGCEDNSAAELFLTELRAHQLGLYRHR